MTPVDHAVMPPPVAPGPMIAMQGPPGHGAIVWQPKSAEHMVGGPHWPLAPPLIPYNFRPPEEGDDMVVLMAPPPAKGPAPVGPPGGKGAHVPKGPGGVQKPHFGKAKAKVQLGRGGKGKGGKPGKGQ
jgi:hypothetical protein